MKKSIIAVSVLFTALGANAQQGKFYWGAELGATHVEDQTTAVTSSFVRAVGGSASATQKAYMPSVRFTGGYTHSENLDVEVAYAQSASNTVNFAGVSGGNVAYTGSIGVSYSSFEYSANLRPNVDTGMNNLFFKVGGHRSKLEGDVSLSTSSVSVSSHQSWSGNGTLFGVGYDQPINNDMKVRYGLTHYNKVAGLSAGGNVVTVGLFKNF